jgi:hypothetical protein
MDKFAVDFDRSPRGLGQIFNLSKNQSTRSEKANSRDYSSNHDEVRGDPNERIQGSSHTSRRSNTKLSYSMKKPMTQEFTNNSSREYRISSMNPKSLFADAEGVTGKISRKSNCLRDFKLHFGLKNHYSSRIPAKTNSRIIDDKLDSYGQSSGEVKFLQIGNIAQPITTIAAGRLPFKSQLDDSGD